MSFRDELATRSADWVSEGVISEEQREAMIARAPEPPEGLLARRLVPGLAIFGGVIVVLGIVLMVSANWGEIPRMTKLVTGVALLVVFQAVGYWVAFGPPARRNSGVALMFIGSGILLADLALITQQYNTEANPSRLILLAWLLGLAAMPYLTGARLFAFASVGTLIVGLGVEAAREGSPIEMEAIAGFLMFVAVGVGVAAYGAAHRLSRFASLAAPIEALGVGVALGLVYLLGFYRHFVDGFDSDVVWETDAAPWLLIGLPSLLLLGATWAWICRARPTLAQRGAWPIAAAVAAAIALLVYVTIVLGNPREFAEPERITWTVGFWLAALTLGAVMIWLGVAYRRSWWTNVALLYPDASSIPCLSWARWSYRPTRYPPRL